VLFSSKIFAEDDVMITIICDFQQYPAKKIAAFLKKSNVSVKILHNFALFLVKNFLVNFLSKIF
jgi:hypothetical protein